MSRITKAVLALALAWPALGAADKPREESASPAEQYRALVQEYTDALTDFSKVYGEAKTQKERDKIFQEQYPSARFAPRFLELAEKNPKDPAAVDALVWVVINVRQAGGGKESPRSRALALLREHAASDKVLKVCQGLAYSSDKDAETFLRTVLEKNPKKEIQAQACLALAGNLKQRLALRQQIDGQPELAKRLEAALGKGAVEELLKEDPAKLSGEAEAAYERAADKYGDVKTPLGTVGEQAKKELFEIRFLSIGKQAPDIEGEDADGKKFKLSDYRGKVVLLDFWGNWCPRCRAMYSHERSLLKRLEAKPFALVGVNSDRSKEELKKVIEMEKMTWRSFFDGGSLDGPIATRWAVRSWPTLYVLDPNGIIRHKWTSSPGDKVVDEAIDKLVEKAAGGSKKDR